MSDRAPEARRVRRPMPRAIAGSASRLAIAFAVLAVALLAPATAGAVRSEFFGIVQGPTLDDRDVQGLQNNHVRTVRFLLAWEQVQAKKTPFTWGTMDKFIGRLAIKGVRVVPSVWGNPNWVEGYTARPPLDRPQDVTAWKTLLKALVARYGPGGNYWQTKYKAKYGDNATPLPVTTWQIWNEPNLKKYFVPYPSPEKYGRLLKVSKEAIAGSRHPAAQIALGGMPGFGDVNAWDFLSQLYNKVSGVKGYFDVAALHPYGPNLDRVKTEIEKFRNSMTSHADAATQLWITESGWGSAPPDQFGINKGPQGQANLLKGFYKMVLQNRKTWNIQRLFWYHWRDPRQSQAGTCSFCGSAGLIKFNRTPKLSLAEFKKFAAETTPPNASITSGPANGATISNPRPTFKFSSNEAGSTFECKVDGGAYKACTSPYKTAQLSDGGHAFIVRATDAPGNVSAPVSRVFSVDTSP